MARWVWRGFVGLSAVLLVATLSVWARAQWVRDGVSHVSSGPAGGPRWLRTVGVESGRWAVRVYVQRFGAEAWAADSIMPVLLDEVAARAGYAYQRAEAGGGPGVGRDVPTVAGFAARTERMTFRQRGELIDFVPAAGGAAVHMEATTVVVPWWSVAAALAAAPVVAWGRWRRARRRGRAEGSRCAACGYDVRATADEGGLRWPVCPECGARVGGGGADTG